MIRHMPLACLAALALLFSGPASASDLIRVIEDGAAHTADASFNGARVFIHASKDGRPSALRIPTGITVEFVGAGPDGAIILNGGTITEGIEVVNGGTLDARGGTIRGSLHAFGRDTVADVTGTDLGAVTEVVVQKGAELHLSKLSLPAKAKLWASDSTLTMEDVACGDTDWHAFNGCTLRFDRCKLTGPAPLPFGYASSVEFNDGLIDKPTCDMSPARARFAQSTLRLNSLHFPDGLELADCNVTTTEGLGASPTMRLVGGRVRGDVSMYLNSPRVDLTRTILLPRSLTLSASGMRMRAADPFVFSCGGASSLVATAADGEPIRAWVTWAGPCDGLRLVGADGGEFALRPADVTAAALTPVPPEMGLPWLRPGYFAQRRAAATRLVAPPFAAMLAIAATVIVARWRRRRPRRLALNLMATASLSLCVVAALMWSRSRGALDAWVYHSPGGTALTLLHSRGGALRVWSDRHATMGPGGGWRYACGPADATAPRLPWPRVASGAGEVWVLPYWLICLATAVLPVTALARMARDLWRRRRQPTACPQCGYDLRASVDRCPECGTTVVTAPQPLASLR